MLTKSDYKKREYTYPNDPYYIIGCIESCYHGYREKLTDADFALSHIGDVVESWNQAKGAQQ